MTALSGSLIFVDYGRWPREVQTGFGLLATAFFGFATTIIARRLFEQGPMLRIDETGIWWRPLSDRAIPWTDVGKAWVSQVRGQRFISLQLHDPERFDWKGRFKYLQPLNGRMGFGDVTLSAQGLDCSFDQLQAAIETHFRLSATPG